MHKSISPRRARTGLAAAFADNLSIGAASPDAAAIGISRVPFSATMIGLGVLGLVHGDFALVWQRILIAYLSGRDYFAYASGLIELLAGIGLLLKPTVAVAARVLFVFVLLWLVLLKLPAVVLRTRADLILATRRVVSRPS